LHAEQGLAGTGVEVLEGGEQEEDD